MNGKQLRNSILQWAISGRLVPQCPADEPAIELLKRINPKAEPLQEDAPFTIPDNWCWCRLGDIGNIVTGSTPSKSIKDYYNGDIPFFKPTDLEQGINVCESGDHISELGYKQSRQLPPNSILVTCIGATIGKTGLTTVAGTCNQQINAIVPNNVVLPLYVYFACVSDCMQTKIKTNASATTLPILNKSKFLELPFPLPPLAEQERIVRKVEELLPLVERYDKAQTELDRLNASLKGKLRASVLQEAISGRLVPQCPADEPAIELLKRINPKFTPQPTDSPLPPGWTACKLGDVLNIMMGQSPSGSSINIEKGVEFHQGKIAFTDRYLEHSNKYTTEPTRIAEPNSLLICVRAPVGDVNISERKICIGRGLCAATPKVGNLTFYFYLLQTLKQGFEAKATGSTFKAISKNIIEEEVIPLPPLAEQERIVSKVEELLAVLGRLSPSAN